MSKPAIVSKVVAPSDVYMIQEYSNQLGKKSQLQGFTQFAEQQALGLFSAAIGVIVDGQPVLLCTIFASREQSGAVLWSARGLDNQQLPGTPDSFSNVMETLKAMDDYMIYMARSYAKPEKKALQLLIRKWWGSAFGFRLSAFAAVLWVIGTYIWLDTYDRSAELVFGPVAAIFAIYYGYKHLVIGASTSIREQEAHAIVVIPIDEKMPATKAKTSAKGQDEYVVWPPR